MKNRLSGRDEERIKDTITSKWFTDMLSTLEVSTKVIENDAPVLKGGSILLAKEDIPGYKGKIEDAVKHMINVFRNEKLPYYASVHILIGKVSIRVYRISEKFEIERYPVCDKRISKHDLDDLKKRFVEGHKIYGKDDFYNDLFLLEETTDILIPLSSDEIIYALSLDTNHFDVAVLNKETRELRIHVIEPENVGLKDMISLMNKFSPEDTELEDGWIVMWFD